MTRNFSATPAKRAKVNLIIGLAGPSSSGKTWSALELATGIQSITGGEIDLIDTEHERALYYAENFKFNHVPFDAPFASLDYLSAIQQSAKRGAKIIVVDSMSHEHESEGGMVDFQEQELTRLTRGDDNKRQTMQMLAWAKPKAARRKLLQGLTQIDAHLILCFRAKNSSKPGKDANGRNVVVPMGFVPIAGEEFVFEASLSMLFHPNAGGVPIWNPEMPGERIAVKIPRQFDWLREQRGPISRDDGKRLAQWARGTGVEKSPTPTPDSSTTEALEPEEQPTLPADLTDFADALDLTIEAATDGAILGSSFNDTMKTSDDWKRLRDLAPKRAAELKDRATARVKVLMESQG